MTNFIIERFIEYTGVRLHGLEIKLTKAIIAEVDVTTYTIMTIV
jgi:hypothetical protein